MAWVGGLGHLAEGPDWSGNEHCLRNEVKSMQDALLSWCPHEILPPDSGKISLQGHKGNTESFIMASGMAPQSHQPHPLNPKVGATSCLGASLDCPPILFFFFSITIDSH